MTRSATTAAGRSAATPRPVQAPGVSGPRPATRPPRGPRGPRRVSGPARGRPAAPAAADRKPSLVARGLLVVRELPEHALLDRVVRGRAWIPLLGVLLVGIVAMQVEILKLGAGMGRWIQRTSTLSTRNQALQASVAGLTDDQRIERLAAKMGMVIPDPTAVSFLSAHPGGDVSRAVANIHAPDQSVFTSQPSGIATAPPSFTSAPGGSGQALDASASSAATTGTDTGASAGSAGTTGTSSDSSQQSGSGGAASSGPASASQSGGASGG